MSAGAVIAALVAACIAIAFRAEPDPRAWTSPEENDDGKA